MDPNDPRRIARSPVFATDPDAASPIFDDDAAVVINGRALDESAIATLAGLYGVQPAPGRYWYDAASGLYGSEGQPPAGLLHPGHDLGPLAREASGGSTGIVVNGRELPVLEWTFLSALVGAPVPPGAYWLDAAGNAGRVGSPLPLVNLRAAAAAGAGGGGGGDNFWSSRFSAGNSNADNSQGYVSVPGYGPVGYGF